MIFIEDNDQEIVNGWINNNRSSSSSTFKTNNHDDVINYTYIKSKNVNKNINGNNLLSTKTTGLGYEISSSSSLSSSKSLKINKNNEEIHSNKSIDKIITNIKKRKTLSHDNSKNNDDNNSNDHDEDDDGILDTTEESRTNIKTTTKSDKSSNKFSVTNFNIIKNKKKINLSTSIDTSGITQSINYVNVEQPRLSRYQQSSINQLPSSLLSSSSTATQTSIDKSYNISNYREIVHNNQNNDNNISGSGNGRDKNKNKRLKTRSKQKNIRKDHRSADKKPIYLQNINSENYTGRILSDETKKRLGLL
jgi:hypothetical protein